MAVGSIKQANTSGTSGNMRSIKKTNSSVSGSKEPSLESQTNISVSGCKDTLNEEETLLPLESQVVAGSNKQTNISTQGDQEPSSDFYNILETWGIHTLQLLSEMPEFLFMKMKKKPISAHWKLSDQKKYFIKILADGANIEQKSESTGLMVSKPSGSSESNEDIANAMLISHFNIPEHLLKKLSKEQDIHATYEKYELIERIWNKH
ncbi:hypothetical protein BDQ17DRAFT_1438974 [Cyathus striatus]|nr:hypothetical protein BDQ17DRAFT_1438974 [Cyathus striatus]